jgi:cytochrome c oxidase subunit 2
MQAHDTEGTHSADVAVQAEYRWALVSGAVILFLLVMIGYMSLHWIAMPSVRMETIDPSTLHLAGDFTEDRLGSTLEPDGSVTVRLLANQYSFTPTCVLVPVGMPVRFRGTSADVVHGFSIGQTNINVMLVPGYISNFHTRFHKTGEMLMPCHEFCGVGHAAMWAHVKVVSRADFMKRARQGGRLNCVEH